MKEKCFCGKEYKTLEEGRKHFKEEHIIYLTKKEVARA